jgi:5-methylcytosine-specific restriction endonuclease McrA
MDGSRNSLYFIQKRAYRVFNQETKQDRYSSKKLLDKAFPTVPDSENKFVNVKGNKSPYDSDIVYGSERECQLYDGEILNAAKRQHHSCAFCGHKFMPGQRINLHHKDGRHSNWKKDNLEAVHESCHDYIHISKSHG